MIRRFFSFDPLDPSPLAFHETEAEAKARADTALKESSIEAAEMNGWPPDLIDNPICWGAIRQIMTESWTWKLSHYEAMARGYDEIITFEMRDV